MRGQCSNTYPADHYGAERERGGFQAHLDCHRVSHAENVAHLDTREQRLLDSSRVDCKLFRLENVKGECQEHKDSGDQCTETCSNETHFRATQFSVNQNPVAEYIEDVSGHEEQH